MAEQTLQTNQQHHRAERTPATREETRYQVPPVDIYEAVDGLAVVVDMPGVDKDGIDIRVDNGILTIQGKVQPVAHGDGRGYNEFVLTDYFRQFQLSDLVDVEKISAELKHGVLTIHLPKAEKAKPKQISVKVAG